MTGAPIIVAERLTKFYGADRGVEDLSFEVHAGEVFGYLGPNGAGKSTTIRTMLDLIRPTGGRVTVFGMMPRDHTPEIHARIGYVPGEFGLYERQTAREYLGSFSALRGGAGAGNIEPLATRLDLDLDRRIRELSHGNKQKIGLLQAFMHEPDLLVLDEPTQGLDPLIQQEFQGMIEDTRERRATVFLSSHILPEVERTCDRVGIIREGRLIAVDDVGNLKAAQWRTVTFHFDGPVDAATFAHLESVHRAEGSGDEVTLTVRGPLDEVVKAAARHTVINVVTREPSLEEIFLETYRDGGAS